MLQKRAQMENRYRRWTVYLLLLIVLLWTLFPIWMAFALSLKHPADFFAAKYFPFFQFSPTLDNWRTEWNAFTDPAGMGRSLWNSTITATLAAGLSLELGGMAAYGMTLRLRDQQLVGWLLGVLLIPRLLPTIVWTLPYMLLLRILHLTDTLVALVIAHTTIALPTAVLLLFSAMREIPFDLVEAAQLDGCTLAAAYWRVVAPLLQPAMFATAALCFAQSWNEFLFAVTNADQKMVTAPLAVAALLNKDGIEFEYVGSHLVMVLLPPLLLALLARRFIVRGLSLGLIRDENIS